MPEFSYPFMFTPSSTESLHGELQLAAPQKDSAGQIRHGLVKVQSANKKLDVVLYSNSATQQVIYLRSTTLSEQLAQLLGVTTTARPQSLMLPGQLLLGGGRQVAVAEGVSGMFATQFMQDQFGQFQQQQIAVLPVLREGVKYGIVENIFKHTGFYCDEVVVDAHHVADESVASYGRRVDVSLFKDIDMTDSERAAIKIAYVGDSTASGIVAIGVLERIKDRFPNVEQVEIIAPLATLFAATRIATYSPSSFKIRLHAFETLLNAEAPDFYWSPHFEDLGFHIQPEMQTAYREWWGQDANGHWMADTACAGYGWSEAFFHPQKFVRMMNEELQRRHQLTIGQILDRKLT